MFLPHNRHAGRISRAGCLCVLLISVVFCVSLASGQEAKGKRPNIADISKQSTILPTNIPIQMSAERLSFNYEKNTYTALGKVTLSQGNTRLRADSIVYQGNTGDLTAKGKVIVRMGSDVIEAEKITINLAGATGVLYNGKLLLTKNNIYLEGKKLEKTGKSTYVVKEGSFTTCNGATPDWKITGKDLEVTLEGYGTLRHGFFYIKNIPVFYLPWLMYPAKRKRQSGFLMPTLANSSIRGFDIRLPIFLDISPSIDATIIPRICTKRAIQAALEFRVLSVRRLSRALLRRVYVRLEIWARNKSKEPPLLCDLATRSGIRSRDQAQSQRKLGFRQELFRVLGRQIRQTPASALSGIKLNPV